MPSADFCCFSQTSRSGLRSYSVQQQTSPGKSAVFLSIYPPHLLPATFGSRDFVLTCRLIQSRKALYGVRVPRARDLPLASFRFHLAADTLALSYGYCCLRHSGLSPYRQRPCWAHKLSGPFIAAPIFYANFKFWIRTGSP